MTVHGFLEARFRPFATFISFHGLSLRLTQPMKKKRQTGDRLSNSESQSFKRNYAGTSIGKRHEKEEEPTDTNHGRENSERQHIPMEPEAVLRWIKDPSNHNAIIAFFTALIFIATAAYAVIAILQWHTMRESNEINRDALESVQRAFVVCHEIEQMRVMREM
jgi:hypothetical protein